MLNSKNKITIKCIGYPRKIFGLVWFNCTVTSATLGRCSEQPVRLSSILKMSTDLQWLLIRVSYAILVLHNAILKKLLHISTEIQLLPCEEGP
jgi:hypothetical protein